MVTNACPACGQPIAPNDINIKEGVGLCRACGKVSRLADIADQAPLDADALTNPPPGCASYEMPGGGTLLRASLRSPGAALGLLAVSLFWNGIVSVFVLFAIAGLYTNLIGPLPKWFPVPSDAGTKNAMTLGTSLFLCVFLFPFVAIGTAMVLGVLLSLFGRIEVLVNDAEGRVRTGFGMLRWTSRFDPSAVTRVVIGQTAYAENGQKRSLIRIEADRTVKFGSMLPDRRRTWMLGALNLLLVARGTRPAGIRRAPG